ncbi:MAG: DNA-directed RNA polymerase subunit alpha [Pedosphaera sp.]|jgi:DNA-directed RNA polymerase subunit alpha|nr:DNA-directed RNA polymerase subunit alpha [Pedosphaera sp.]HCE05391.1 DNA-directed RNA polymerase subunit alpha [Verrucomicrobiales bacterium]|tara:strand:+ start:1275 stop:2366 length:1092 start_codon:yes stop_codon:yes gene_type:complete
MPKRLGAFERPNRLKKEEETATETYAKFVAEPFEIGYAHTIGNSMRRVLLSSLEGAAITSLKVDGAQHEFAAIEGVVEDMAEIILNLKQVKFKIHETRDPQVLLLSVNKSGAVTAADIELNHNVELVNPDQHICTLDKKKKFLMELTVQVGRGFLTGDDNKTTNQPIGVIAIDSIFSPVTRVRYDVGNARVGQRTDYDSLALEIWTDGRITPDDAVNQASQVLMHQLEVFVNYDKDAIEFEEEKENQTEEQSELKRLLAMSVNEIELSVRAANCLNNANITSVGQLATKSEADMLKYRNFGKKSLNEIKDKLVELGLGLGMTFDESVLDPADLISKPNSSGGSPSILFEDDGEPIGTGSSLLD